MTWLAFTPAHAPKPRSARGTALPYINLIVFEPQFQIVVNGFVGDLAEQGEVRDTNLLFLGALKGGLLDLRFALPTIANIGDCFGASKAALLLAALGTS